MANVNKVILVGNLTRDLMVKHLPSNTTVAEGGLAINRKWRTQDGQDREEVCFVDFAAFGKQAETLEKYVKKGDPLFIEGRIKYDTWEDKQGGGKRSKLSVVVENFQFLGGKRDGTGESDAPPARQPSRPAPAARAPSGGARPSRGEEAPPFDGPGEINMDDVPFHHDPVRGQAV